MFQTEEADVREFSIDSTCKECAAVTNGLIPKQTFIPLAGAEYCKIVIASS